MSSLAIVLILFVIIMMVLAVVNRFASPRAIKVMTLAVAVGCRRVSGRAGSRWHAEEMPNFLSSRRISPFILSVFLAKSSANLGAWAHRHLVLNVAGLHRLPEPERVVPA
jgi:hypothetical protein